MSIDNAEIEEVLNKLESLHDEELAVKLLQEFNEKTRVFGKLIMNMDPNLTHEEWKQKCDGAKKEVDEVIKRIRDSR